jgi:hypothetical protein
MSRLHVEDHWRIDLVMESRIRSNAFTVEIPTKNRTVKKWLNIYYELILV